MTERGRGAVARDASSLAIGPSRLEWDGACLRAELRERGTPTPRALAGEIRIRPRALTGHCETLDPATGRHLWLPIAPRCDVELTLAKPSLAWRGEGYLDSNAGSEPLEHAFSRWDWTCARAGSESAILYEAEARENPAPAIALRIDAAGRVERFAPPRPVALGRSAWRLARRTRAEEGHASVARTLLDAPFYARSVLETRLLGRTCTAMHESLDLERFVHPLIQAMLPFRNPRSPFATRTRPRSG